MEGKFKQRGRQKTQKNKFCKCKTIAYDQLTDAQPVPKQPLSGQNIMLERWSQGLCLCSLPASSASPDPSPAKKYEKRLSP